MKRILALSLLTLIFLTSCQKDQAAPDVNITRFSINELPELVFDYDTTAEPILIMNKVLLPAGKGMNGGKSQENLFVKTEDLPGFYPGADVVVSEPDEMEPGMILVYLKMYNDSLENGTKPIECILDAIGKVRWYYHRNLNSSFQRLKNCKWLIGQPDGAYERDMIGQRTGRDWSIPHGHHNIVELPNDNFLALSDHDLSVEDVVIEISRELFCPGISDAEYLPQTDNSLICFGGIIRNLNGNPSKTFDQETASLIPVKNFAKIIEVDNSGKVVFEIIFADKTLSFAAYRS